MNKIKQLQEILIKNKIDAYLITTGDYHNSEYISDYFKTRAYMSEFTGSAGMLLVLQDKAYLWADGRYHIQAQKQINESVIQLMKQGLTGVPSIFEFIKKELKDNSTLAFDGKVVPANMILSLKNILPHINLKYEQDLINQIWEDRPILPFSLLYKYEEFFTGKSFKDKLNDIRTEMKNNKCDYHILTKLEDQAWLYNLRANDVLHTPVFLSFTIINENQCHLYIDIRKIDKNIEKYLRENDVIVHDYFEFFEIVKTISHKTILLDENIVSYYVYNNLKLNNIIKNRQNPSILLKAIKTPAEIENTKNAHIKDGVAFTKFMYYVKTNIPANNSLTELSVQEYLENQRRNQHSFVDLSFDTICAYKDHAAMMHYSASKDSNASLKPEDFLLVDSGGHYLDGSTDITRTLALGPLTDTQKLHFTTVLQSVIALSEAVFLKGCKGVNLDILARGPIWKLLIDYKCGTGHGIGHLLSVHEAPNGFRWQIVPERNDSSVLVPGMITTNEPGIYLENKYGIRIENELLCVEKATNEFGEFLCFETITYAPIDLDAINVNLLNQQEKDWLNNYHKDVYDKISPFLEPEEQEWLKEYTRAI